jgi:pyrroloquinoline quinone biosynthesis protein B
MKYILLFLPFFFFACVSSEEECAGCDPESIDELTEEYEHTGIEPVDSMSLVVLGTCQDAGSPQINCQKDCCIDLHSNPDPHRMVVSLGLIDPENEKKYLFEATPDMPQQLSLLEQFNGDFRDDVPDGVFLTHAHIGHYTGLMYFGKEAMDADKVPVHAMPRMSKFLEENGPWSLLVERENIELAPFVNDLSSLEPEYPNVFPLLVPHRDEFSETVGYLIQGPNKSALFIPDIDKWEKWEMDIVDMVKKVDYAFLDGTFYDGSELPNRDMSEVPHPFVVESMDLFKDLDAREKQKIIFIHFNHTNPLLDKDSEAYHTVIENGFKVAQLGDVYSL